VPAFALHCYWLHIGYASSSTFDIYLWRAISYTPICRLKEQRQTKQKQSFIGCRRLGYTIHTPKTKPFTQATTDQKRRSTHGKKQQTSSPEKG
jgi:hypothetical protein